VILKARFPKIFASVFTALVLILYMPGLVGLRANGTFSNVQALWHDFLFKVNRDNLRPADPRLILLAVDDETVAKYGFPLPRIAYARALDKMKALGVDTVMFDVMFFEKREGDAELTASTKRFGKVVHLFAFTEGEAKAKPSLPIPELRKATRYFGSPNVDYLASADGHLRTFQLFRPGIDDPLRGKPPTVSFAAAALSAAQNVPIDDLIQQYGEDERVVNYRRPEDWKRHPGDKSPQATIDVSPYRRISALDLLDGTLAADQRAALKGAIVIVGSTTLGYYDKFPMAFGDAPGAEFHLHAIDNTLHGDAMRSPYRAWTLLLIIAAVLLTYWLQRLPTAYGAGLAGASFLSWVAYAQWAFRRGTIAEFVPPAFAFVASYLVLVAHRALTEGAEKKQITRQFGQFVSPDVVEDLIHDPSKAQLVPEKRELTIFFLDIAHFTTISEKMDAEALVQFLNKYLSGLSDVVFEHHGTIDKFIGDCIMAFWNAPLRNKDHRAEAILAALGCQRAIAELNKNLDKGLPEVPAARIGISSGPATVGFVGTQRKLQYTVIGDEVNLASRLEGANKFFGSKIIVSESTWEGAKDRVVARFLGSVRVVGKETPIRIFEPLAEKSKLSADWAKALPQYEKGLKAFEKRKFKDALKSFEHFLEIFPDDGPARLYRDRSRDYAAIEPDESWDGVFNLTAK